MLCNFSATLSSRASLLSSGRKKRNTGSSTRSTNRRECRWKFWCRQLVRRLPWVAYRVVNDIFPLSRPCSNEDSRDSWRSQRSTYNVLVCLREMLGQCPVKVVNVRAYRRTSLTHDRHFCSRRFPSLRLLYKPVLLRSSESGTVPFTL